MPGIRETGKARDSWQKQGNMNQKNEATEIYCLIVKKLEVQREVQDPSGMCEEGIFAAFAHQASLAWHWNSLGLHSVLPLGSHIRLSLGHWPH